MEQQEPTEVPLTLTTAIESIDYMEDSYIQSCRDLRRFVVDVFGADSDEMRLAALQTGCDAEYELTGDTNLFGELANQLGLSDALSEIDELSSDYLTIGPSGTRIDPMTSQ